MIDTRYREAAGELTILAALLAAGLALYLLDLGKSAVLVIYAGSLAVVLLLICSVLSNMIFAARLFLIVIVGAYPLAIKLLDDNLYFSVFEFTTQTFTIAKLMYALSLLGMVGAYLGWRLGAIAGEQSRDASAGSLPQLDDYYFWVFWLSAAFSIMAGLLIAGSSTGTILDAAYGTGTEGSPLIGSASAIGGIALSVMFYCAMVARRRTLWLVFAATALYLLLWCQILRGLRQDVVGAAFSCLILFLMFRFRDVGVKLHYVCYVVPLFLLLELWGVVRSGLSQFLAGEVTFGRMLDIGLGNAAIIPGVVYSGTLGPITTTFANVLALFERGAVHVLYGAGYFDYILRTPPEFLYPDRPRDYATMFSDYGLSSGGGFFELAEAYLNFGLIGAFIVPLAISFFIALFYTRALRSLNIFYIFSLSSILCVWLRGSWYQTFAFYKSFVSGLLLYLLIHTGATLLAKRQAASDSRRALIATNSDHKDT